MQGLGILVPTNLRAYFEMRRPEPDGEKISGLMRRYIKVVAVQAVLQFAIIFIMGRWVTGLERFGFPPVIASNVFARDVAWLLDQLAERDAPSRHWRAPADGTAI